MYYADDYIKQDFADRVLIDNNLKYINGLIIWECLSEASIKVKESFCRNFLQNNDWKNITDGEGLIITVFNDATDKIKQEFADKNLSNGDWKKNRNGKSIIEYATVYASYETKKTFFIDFLTSDWKDYLDDSWRDYEDNIYYQCLEFFENEKENISEVEITIEKIIKNFHNPKSKRKFIKHYYFDLLRYNFNNYVMWESETQDIIKDWKNRNRDLITNILYSYKKYPENTYNICLDILSQWKEEVSISLYCIDHIVMALGHPLLKIQAKATASDILQTIKRSRLKEIALQIVENDLYPLFNHEQAKFKKLPESISSDNLLNTFFKFDS